MNMKKLLDAVARIVFYGMIGLAILALCFSLYAGLGFFGMLGGVLAIVSFFWATMRAADAEADEMNLRGKKPYQRTIGRTSPGQAPGDPGPLPKNPPTMPGPFEVERTLPSREAALKRLARCRGTLYKASFSEPLKEHEPLLASEIQAVLEETAFYENEDW